MQVVFRIALFFAGLCMFCFGQVHGESFFVALQGSDSNTGTREKPWKTIQQACDTLRPGDTAYVQPGTYYENVQVNVSGSAAGGFITLQAQGSVVVSGAKAPGGTIISIEDQSYIRIAGFEICNSRHVDDGSGIRVEGSGSHIELLNNRIHGIRGKDAMGITVYGTAAKTPLSDIVIDGNDIYDCDPAESEALVLNGNITQFHVVNNSVHDVNNIGIDFIGGEKSICSDVSKVVRNGVCRGNRIARARSSYGGGYAAGIYVDGARDITIEGNTVTESDLGIEVGAENHGAVASGIIVQDNVIFRNDKAGLVFGGYMKKAGLVKECRFLRNICWKNGGGRNGTGELWIQYANGNEIKGNIFSGLAGRTLLQVEKGGDQNILDDNLWYCNDGTDKARFSWRGREITGFQAYVVASGQDRNSRFADPQFVHPEAGDFNRRSASP